VGDAGVPGRDSTRMDLMALGWGCGVLVPVPRCCRVLAGGGADAGLPWALRCGAGTGAAQRRSGRGRAGLGAGCARVGACQLGECSAVAR